MEAILIIFFIMIILGAVQILAAHKQKTKAREFLKIINNQNQTKSTIEDKLLKYNVGVEILDLINDFIYHLKGNNKKDGMRNLIILCVILAVFYYFNVTSLKLPTIPLLIVVMIISCYFLYIAAKKRARIEFETTFAEALNIIGSAVSVGNTVLSGIEQCGDKLSGFHLGEVFKKVHQRMEIGEDVETVLLDTYSELHYREYYFFAIAIIINMKGGGQLKEIMSRLGQIITNGRVMEKKKLAKTSEARMSVKILAIMPLAMFFILKFISPQNYEVLIETNGGHIILIYVVGSTLLGLAITWSMMNKV